MRVEKGTNADMAWTGMLGYTTEVGQLLNPQTIDRLEFGEAVVEIFGKQSDNQWQFGYQIDPTQTPKTIDLWQYRIALTTATNALNAVGIYEIHGDQLKICFARSFLR